MKKKKANYIEEIALPLMTVRKNGNSLCLTIPNSVIAKYDIGKGDKVFAILLRRKKTVLYEVKDDEKLVKMTKKEAKEYEKFREFQ
jgi:antitoxin component of MazEF toxin-antitoxin module